MLLEFRIANDENNWDKCTKLMTTRFTSWEEGATYAKQLAKTFDREVRMALEHGSGMYFHPRQLKDFII